MEEKPGMVPIRKEAGRIFSFFLLSILLVGLAYEAILLFTPWLAPYRFPIPYAVPIFDIPFALVGIGVGYLCLERHRFRQDLRSASLGTTLWLAALLALAHIVTQPDYPGTPGVPAGVAPYFFFLSYLAGFAGIGLATHPGDRHLPLTDRGRLCIVIGVFVLSILVVIAVWQIRPVLPPLVMKPGRLTPFAVWAAAVGIGLPGVWAVWGGAKKFFGKEGDAFAGFLLLSAFVWLFGLIGFLACPFRYGVSWYGAGLARPIGVGVIFLGLLREQVWLYREAHSRQRDLEGLHTAGQALVASLDPHHIVQSIATKALEVSGAAGAILFRLDAEPQVLRSVSFAGRISPDFVSCLELPIGVGVSGLAVAERRPVWTANLPGDTRIPLPPGVRERVRQEGHGAVLGVPLLIQSGEVFGALVVSYQHEREFAETDVGLLSAFGAQASAAIENARSFDQLALKARHDAALQAFGQRLLECTGEEAVLTDAVRVTQDLLQADFVGLLLFDPETGCLRLKAGRGWAPGIVGVVTLAPTGESFAGYSFLHKERREVADLSGERGLPTPAYLEAHGVRAGVTVPLGVRDQPFGVLEVYYRMPHRVSDEESRALMSLAHQTALALGKVRLYAQLQANLQRLQETQAQLIQADKLTALGTLLSGMAHELNNPLSSILLNVELLTTQHALPDSLRKQAEAIAEEAERAARIIRDLLVFARRRPPERRRVDLNTVVKAALDLQAPAFDLHQVRVVKQLDPALPEVGVDPHQLQQVFLNLFTNATHAMKSAHPSPILTVRSFRDGSEICVEVDDTGPGIPPAHLGRIFDPFFTTKGAGEGTGLGLSLSIGIVEAHRGRMHAENLPGTSGARFCVRLPIEEGPKQLEAPAPKSPPEGHPARILVVDDEQGLRAALAQVFAARGHQVEEATTGKEAMARLEGQAYDLVALDLRLPDVDGREVWQWILSNNPALASRVVFMTGDIMSAQTEKFLQEAGRPSLTKPMTITQLDGVLSQVLKP